MTEATKNNRVCLGQIIGVHGVKGALKIRSFTENPADVVGYPETELEESPVTFHFLHMNKGIVVARMDTVETRDQAEALKGQYIYTTRANLPTVDEDEYYLSDLAGLKAMVGQKRVGIVERVDNYGGGAIITVSLDQSDKKVDVPFRKEFVLSVGLAAGVVALDGDYFEALQKPMEQIKE